MSTELPQRARPEYYPLPEDIRLAGIFRIAEEQNVSFDEAEAIYNRLLENIHRALYNS